MRKHRLRNKIKSIVGSHIDPDKDEELKGSIIETEDKYEKILELLKEEEDQENKSKLVGLIEEFHNRYQFIYDRYDNITGKLKEKLQSKIEKDSSSSSSSDSDSEDPSNKNGKSKNEMYMTAESLKAELQAANREIEDLKKKLAVETEEKVSNLIQKLETTELENKSDRDCEFNNRKRKLNQKEIKTERNKVQELSVECRELREKLANKNVDQEKLLNEKEVYKSKVKDLELKLKLSADEIENGIQSKEKIINQLEETIEDLRGDLEIKGDEVNTLTEIVRNLEVKIRLANQKLRITEQIEHDHTMKEEKLHQENVSLVNKITSMSESITAIKMEVQETLTGFDSLTVKFEEDYGHVTRRVCEITNEVQALQIQAKKNLSEKDDLKQEVEETVMKLKVSEGENERLMESVERMKTVDLRKDEKIKELESKEIWDLWEDKREAIKQLCIWGEYHRDRYDHLQELLKTTTGGRRHHTSQTVR